MNKIIPILSFLLFTTLGLFAQNYDNETAETTLSWQYFGSSIDGEKAEVIANPFSSGINTSANVVKYDKPAGSETWAGAFSEPTLPTPLDVTAGGQVCVDVYFDHIGNLAFKLEKSTNGVGNWIISVPNTVMNEWETLCFDLDLPGLEDAMNPATGGIFEGAVVFFDFGMNDADNSVTTYFDNVRYEPGVTTDECVVIFDFEAPETTTTYQYFGSSLDGTLASNILNPNPTGINESDTVMQYVKPVGSESWAGAFANPAPTNPIDFIAGGQLCVDVHMDHIGNIALKLEGSSTIGNWLQTVENTVVGEWEQLCIDVSLNGLEDDMTPAAGHVFTQLVIFPDFGTVWDVADVTTYIDNLCYIPLSTSGSHDVTFNVDMNSYSGAFTQPYLSGTFNDWSQFGEPMSDDDLDGIWTTTLSLATGAYEYKFQLDGWVDSDQMLESDECVITTVDMDGNSFSNRALLVSGEVDMPAVCFNSCYACGDEVIITWNVNMANEAAVSEDGVYVAGGEYFGHGDLPSMTDDDGDGIHSITLRRGIGFETDYTFINGLCLPDWSCKEMIAGQACAVDPFNDRHLGPVAADIVINTCFGECSETTECTGGPVKFMATFNVDMTNTTVDASGVFLAGGLINNWNAADNPMTDDDGDNVWSTTVELAPGIVEYKYVNGTTFESIELLECTTADPSGEFINRLLIMESKDTVVTSYLWESCDVFVGLDNTEFSDNLFQLQPNLVTDFTKVICTVRESKLVQVYNLNGQMLQSQTMGKDQEVLNLDLSNTNAGMYIISVTTDNYRSTKRVIVK